MAENKSTIQVAGGSLGWGGYVNRGNKFVASHESTDCLNVWNNKGVLEKRQGYIIVDNVGYVLVGEYSPTSTGSEPLSATNLKLSQEVYLSGAGAGGDINFDGSASKNFVVALCLSTSILGNDSILTLKIYGVDGSGHPSGLKGTATGYHNNASLLATENWIYFAFENIDNSINCCLVLENTDGDAAGTLWHYSNGSGGYAPGGARVSAYWNGAAWVDFVGYDFKFKVYYGLQTGNYNSIHQYLNLNSDYFTHDNFDTINAAGEGIVFLSKDSSYQSGFNIYSSTGYVGKINSSRGTGYLANKYLSIFPPSIYTTDNAQCAIYDSNIVLGSENYLFATPYSHPLRIKYFSTTNNYYSFATTPYGLVIAPNNNVPQIWGSTSYPITGYTGDMAFTGLTNPITKCGSVMYHKNKVWMGNVTINSVEYKNRIYFSGIDTPESGYSDTGYITIEGKVTAMVDMGEYAILSDVNQTYLLLGAASSTTIELIKHTNTGGVINNKSLCAWKDDKENNLCFGFGPKGMFAIDANSKKFIDEKIQADIKDLICIDTFICPDFTRNLILFGYISSSSSRIILGFDINEKTWWKENLPFSNMISYSLTNQSKIFGISGFSLFDVYKDYASSVIYNGYTDNLSWVPSTGRSTSGTYIDAYYKSGPIYFNDLSKFKPRNIFVVHRNENDYAPHFDIKYSGDYSTEVVKTISLRNSSYTKLAPVVKKINCSGEATSAIITLYQYSNATTLTAEASASQNYVDVADASKYVAGQLVVFYRNNSTSEFFKVVSSVSGNRITFTSTMGQIVPVSTSIEEYNGSFGIGLIEIEVYASNKVPQDK